MGLLDLARRLTGRAAGPQRRAPAPQFAATAPLPPPQPFVPTMPVTPQATGDEAGEAGKAPPQPDAGRFFVYATGRECSSGKALDDAERAVLRNLELLLQAPGSILAWIPRPPAVLPRLLACLRDDDASLREACALLHADPYLAAEILRLANSARHQHGAPVTDLERAATRLGVDGLRRAVSSSLLRPLFDARREPVLALALPRLWAHAQSKSGWCQDIAGEHGVDSFDAYLAGLTHNLGWIGALKALGRAGVGAAPQYSRDFVQALSRCSERMFACGAEQWAVNDSLSRLGRVLSQRELRDCDDALARVLCEADARATEEVAAA